LDRETELTNGVSLARRVSFCPTNAWQKDSSQNLCKNNHYFCNSVYCWRHRNYTLNLSRI